MSAIVERELRELRERRDAATTYATLARDDEASTLRLQVEVLAALL